MLNKLMTNQGNIALVLVIMITSLTLVSAVALTLVNVSEKLANYHLTENEDVLNQKQTCLDEALLKISNNLYATGTYALDLTNVHCYYQMSETVSGLKTVTTTASSLSALGAWSQSAKAIVNVSSTPISIDSYNDIVGANWDSSAWTRRMRISVLPDKVAGDLYNFPVYLNLADLGSDFFSTVKSNGGDIVVTAGDGQTKLLRELVFIDTINDLGEVHFLAPYLSSEISNDFYIYFGNVDGAEVDDLGVWADYQMVQHFTEDPSGSAPQMLDSSANHYNGTSAGTMTTADLITGKIGKALDLDGGDDYISLTDYSRLDLDTDDFTISYWVNTTSLTLNHMISKYETTNDRWYNRVDSTGRLQFYNVVDGVVTLQMYPSSVIGLDSGQWDHIIFASDRDFSNYIYKNGQNITLTTNVTSTIDLSTNIDCRIGSYNTDGFLGQLDEVRYAKKVFSTERIATEYNNQSDSDTFYSTSSVEVLGDFCGGVSMFGYCWYMASNVGMSCDQVCTENGGLTCISDVSYGPDTTCALNKALGPPVPPNTCSLLCFDGGGITYDPGNHTSQDVCLYDTTSPAISCSTVENSGGTFRIICACE